VKLRYIAFKWHVDASLEAVTPVLEQVQLRPGKQHIWSRSVGEHTLQVEYREKMSSRDRSYFWLRLSNMDGKPTFKIGEGFVGLVWHEGVEKLYTDISKDAHDIIVKKGERRYNSIIGVPIKNGNEVIGVVVVSSQQANEVSEADYDNISRYLNIIQLSLLIEFSNNIKIGGDGYETLVRLLQQKTNE
jgi:hypothetical protein